ncbi:hypothetical protein GTP58_20245 [Duganella sp. CY15W]|uniref:hypothetical protein n=1 Tax=Duganella sp. CY15W TaxID=2692172 RepID=UPI00136C1BB7|nr:hypothetical protein [Duganella sp. CY15W]MYM30667.1 hypothetical protein [Duganella sp. CY15W]
MNSIPSLTKEEKEKFNRLWEDSLIILFRDEQWARRTEELIQKINFASADFTSMLETPEKFDDKMDGVICDLKELLKLRRSSMPPLLKFDGNTESVTADVFAQAGRKFYLFEFKSDATAINDEVGKLLYNIFTKVNWNDPSCTQFLNLSRACHHIVFAEKKSLTSLTNHTSKPLLTYSVELNSKPYIESLIYHRHIAAPASFKPFKSKITSIKKLFNNTPTLGTKFEDICVYLKMLSVIFDEQETIQDDDGKQEDGTQDSYRTPFKCVIASDDGYIWPIVTLNSFFKLALAFRSGLTEEKFEKKYQDYSDGLVKIIANNKTVVDDLRKQRAASLKIKTGK